MPKTGTRDRLPLPEAGATRTQQLRLDKVIVQGCFKGHPAVLPADGVHGHHPEEAENDGIDE